MRRRDGAEQDGAGGMDGVRIGRHAQRRDFAFRGRHQHLCGKGRIVMGLGEHGLQRLLGRGKGGAEGVADGLEHVAAGLVDGRAE